MPLLSEEDRNELDFETIGPILESLINSDRVTDSERRAIDLCARAAVDLLQAENAVVMESFYARNDIQQHIAKSISDWLEQHGDAKAGEMAYIPPRWYVASHDSKGQLQLTKVAEAWWPEGIDER